jgi:formiminotetrahydrofolate cyclodeaminase
MCALLDASRLPRGTDAEREARAAAIGTAAYNACQAPRLILASCRDVAQATERLAGRSYFGLVSDLVVASRLVEGAARGVAENVFVNPPSVSDTREADPLASEIRWTVSSVSRLARATRRHVAAHQLREPEPVDAVASAAERKPSGAAL